MPAILFIIGLCNLSVFPFTAANAQESFETALSIELNYPVSGMISNGGETQWYKFNATEDSSYVITVFNQSISMNAFFTLYSSEKSILAWSYTKINYNFTEADTYFIEVKHSDSKYGVGYYSLLLRAALPPSLVLSVFDADESFTIENATARVYTPVGYRLLGENQSSTDGVIRIQLPAKGNYFVTVEADGYNDEYGLVTLLDEGDNFRWATLAQIRYSGFIVSSALVKEVIAPGELNEVEVTIINANATYPILLKNITIFFPWFGFYGGNLEGFLMVSENLPVSIPADTIWTTSIPFVAPSDVTAYLGSVIEGSFVDFFVEAPAWRTTNDIENGSFKEKRELTNVDIRPDLQESQGFRVPLFGISLVPITDPVTVDELRKVSAGINDISLDIEELSSKLDEVTFRISEVNVGLETVESRLNDIRSNIDETNEEFDEANVKLNNIDTRLEDMNLRLGSSDNKLSGISSNINNTNTKLSDVSFQLEEIDNELTMLGSYQDETNSKLESIENQLKDSQEQNENLITDVMGDLRLMLLVIIGVVIVIAASNIFYLFRKKDSQA
jgi:uncharacterized protein Smg (DUF494 family)